ncbi:hypothetical protein ACTXT7_005170 [Hymenolepis weldensis]
MVDMWGIPGKSILFGGAPPDRHTCEAGGFETDTHRYKFNEVVTNCNNYFWSTGMTPEFPPSTQLIIGRHKWTYRDE